MLPSGKQEQRIFMRKQLKILFAAKGRKFTENQKNGNYRKSSIKFR